jgi:hypothetical protein
VKTPIFIAFPQSYIASIPTAIVNQILTKTAGMAARHKASPQIFKEHIMDRFFKFISTHQAAALSLSLAIMVSSSLYFMVEAFDHMV